MTIAEILKVTPLQGASPILCSENRACVRTWLSRCGVNAQVILRLTLAQLAECYTSSEAFKRHTGIEPRSDAIDCATQHPYTPRNEKLKAWLRAQGHNVEPAPSPAKPEVKPDNSDVESETEDKAEVKQDLSKVQSENKAAKALADLLSTLSSGALNESRVIELIREHAPKAQEIEREKIVIMRDSLRFDVPDAVHSVFPRVMRALAAKRNVLLVGPAGSGKTHLGQQAAKVLKLEFGFSGAVDSAYKLLGFVDAQGRPVRTPYRERYEHGGVFLWDEMDASAASALLAFNAGLANGHQDFPDAIVPRHKDTLLIASANTYGRGHDRLYVGRMQLDAASLNRFCVIPMDYDEKLEIALYGNNDWVHYVQKVRAKIRALNIRHVVSMRAMADGLALFAQGEEKPEVEESVLWQGLDAGTVATIKAGL